MKLTLQGLEAKTGWESYRLPTYDIAAVRGRTAKHPTWLHFGAGSIFRAYPAMLVQRLLTAGLMDTGIIVCESYDEELIDRVYRPFENLSIAATLHADGSIKKEVVGSITESLKLSEDWARVREIFCNPGLQMVSFTITEKAYTLREGNREFKDCVIDDLERGPEHCTNVITAATAMCLERKKATDQPLALVSLDNCSHNGTRLQRAVLEVARVWKEHGFVTEEDIQYLTTKISYPYSVIDKITPHPDHRILSVIQADGIEGIDIFKTERGTAAAAFTNAEKTQYLLIEDKFPNGHPPLEQTGVIFTTRSIVDRTARMKACTCLNPIDTSNAVFGCLFGYDTIAETMKDADLQNFNRKMSYDEAIPMVSDPGVVDPWEFLHEVLTERLPNPYLADQTKRIATDTSHKLGMRFGETILAYYDSPVPKHRVSRLRYIPFVLAGWLRYLIAVDDKGRRMELSPDPRLDSLREILADVELGMSVPMRKIEPIICDKFIFGVNLAEVGLDDTVLFYFNEMLKGPGAVRTMLKRVCSDELFFHYN